MEGDRQVYLHDKFYGHQDTWLTWGSTASGWRCGQYVYGSIVDGDVDFIFGDGALVIDRSTINVENDGPVLQRRTGRPRPPGARSPTAS